MKVLVIVLALMALLENVSGKQIVEGKSGDVQTVVLGGRVFRDKCGEVLVKVKELPRLGFEYLPIYLSNVFSPAFVTVEMNGTLVFIDHQIEKDSAILFIPAPTSGWLHVKIVHVKIVISQVPIYSSSSIPCYSKVEVEEFLLSLPPISHVSQPSCSKPYIIKCNLDCIGTLLVPIMIFLWCLAIFN